MPSASAFRLMVSYILLVITVVGCLLFICKFLILKQVYLGETYVKLLADYFLYVISSTPPPNLELVIPFLPKKTKFWK